MKYDPSLDERDVHGASPVHYASQFENNKDVDRKRLEILRRLIELEASFECTDNEGRRPLHWAASSGKIRILIHFYGLPFQPFVIEHIK